MAARTRWTVGRSSARCFTWPTGSPYRRLNDAVCVCVGEVRAASDPGQTGPDLLMDVAELIWEPIAD